MSWAEIKKAVNSDLDTPLNKLIFRDQIYTYSDTFVYGTDLPKTIVEVTDHGNIEFLTLGIYVSGGAKDYYACIDLIADDTTINSTNLYITSSGVNSLYLSYYAYNDHFVLQSTNSPLMYYMVNGSSVRYIEYPFNTDKSLSPTTQNVNFSLNGASGYRVFLLPTEGVEFKESLKVVFRSLTVPSGGRDSNYYIQRCCIGYVPK